MILNAFGDLPAERVGVDVVDECALAVDLHDREPFPIAGLELGISADVDLSKLEAELVPDRPDGLESPLAKVTTLRRVDDDGRQPSRLSG